MKFHGCSVDSLIKFSIITVNLNTIGNLQILDKDVFNTQKLNLNLFKFYTHEFCQSFRFLIFHFSLYECQI